MWLGFCSGDGKEIFCSITYAIPSLTGWVGQLSNNNKCGKGLIICFYTHTQFISVYKAVHLNILGAGKKYNHQ